jgi:hypothetical protein
MYLRILLIGLLIGLQANSQTLGGNAVFNFLSLPNTAKQSALGGVNISSIGNDVGMSFQNPSLLRNSMHQQANTSFNAFIAGINNYSLTSAYHVNSIQTNLALGVNYLDYGNITQTDASGIVYGNFRPSDYVLQVMASRQYHERFWYGLTMKYIQSNYGQYRASGLAFDVGLSYYDSSKLLQVSLVAKNMGTQLRTYDGSNSKEELPFDLQVGITKRLAHAPVQFSVTAQHLQAFNTYYNDTSFRAAEGELDYSDSWGQKLLSHFVISSEIFLDKKLELLLGYNFQRRQDMNAYQVTNGLNGFTMGAGLLLNKLHVRYATGFYQRNMFHQFSLNFNWAGKLE